MMDIVKETKLKQSAVEYGLGYEMWDRDPTPFTLKGFTAASERFDEALNKLIADTQKATLDEVLKIAVAYDQDMTHGEWVPAGLMAKFKELEGEE